MGLLTGAGMMQASTQGRGKEMGEDRMAQLEEVAERPVLDLSDVHAPIVVEAVDVLRPVANKYVVRVRSRDGAEGFAVGNELHFGALYPILQQRIAPAIIGRDVRYWEECLHDIFLHRSNYKLQGLAFWLPLATLEFAVLDLLGRVSERAVPDMVGGFVRKGVGLYYAHNDRDRTAEDSVRRMRRNVERTGAKAVKFKVGGRMSRNADSLPGRTEAIIPLAREVLGAEMTLYADSNGSYDVAEAIRVGRLLEGQRVAFFEEPVPFDRFADTKSVADALDIPIAGGEQDASSYNLQWSLALDALQVVQPDLFYFGGLVRSIRVARMAAAVGRDCTPHISGAGMGFLYVLHFAAAVSNAGPHQEFKGVAEDIPWECSTSSLRPENGVVQVPTGPGWGIELDPQWIAQAKVLGPI